MGGRESMKKIFCAMASIVVFLGCNDTAENKSPQKTNSMQSEFELLSSVSELDSLLTRSGDEIVDWQLSKEFAQLALDSFINDGDYSTETELWDYPICIYSSDGSILYYEFRVIDHDEVTAAIACNAKESSGGPVAHIFSMKGYTDAISSLYKKGALNENELPRIVDDAYPSYAVGIAEITKSGDVNFGGLIDPATGERIEETSKTLTVEEMIGAYPFLYDEEEKSIAFSEIENYRIEMENFWSVAKESKGSIADAIFRGKSKNVRKSIDNGKIKNTNTMVKERLKVSSTPVSYGACGATAAGFVLDYLYSNGFDRGTKWWSIDSKKERKKELENIMDIGGRSVLWIKNATLMSNLGKAVSKYTGYRLSPTSFWPKTSINNNLPGINLRGLKITNIKGGMHYRNVTAYKEEGWWIFKWQYIKILDGNNIDNGWEAYNPFYHIKSWNVVKK